MAFNADTSGKQIVEYSPDDTYSALIISLERSSHFIIKQTNQIARTIAIKTKIMGRKFTYYSQSCP